MLSPSKQIFYNIVGGIIVAILTAFALVLWRILSRWWFQRIFGPDTRKGSQYQFVFGTLVLPPLFDSNCKQITHPYRKPSRNSPNTLTQHGFSVERTISSCEVRGVKYLSSIFALRSPATVILSADTEIKNKLDISMVSLGGPGSNYKTEDILSSEANLFVRMEANGFVSAKSGRSFMSYDTNNYDYGLILKLSPPQYPNRIWVVCAGLGEWGTSGAAFYLSRHWKKLLWKNLAILNLIGIGCGRDFAAIIKVKREQDESADLVKNYRDDRSIEEEANAFANSSGTNGQQV